MVLGAVGVGVPVVATLVVSGKSAARVASWAAVLADWMEGAGAAVALADVAHTLNHHRAPSVRCSPRCVRADRGRGGGGVARGGGGAAGAGGGGARMRGRVGRVRCLCIRVRVRSGRGWVGSCWPMSRRLLRRWPSWSRFLLSRSGFRCARCLAGGQPVAGIDADSAGVGGDAVGVDGVVAFLRGATRMR